MNVQTDRGIGGKAGFAFPFRLALAVAGGAAIAVFGWLWYNYGMDVVLAYAAGVAMQCF